MSDVRFSQKFARGLIRNAAFTASVPVAIWSEMKHTRKVPYVTGVLMLMVSQIIFMEAPYYWVMCLARCLQGVGTGTRLVVGLAML